MPNVAQACKQVWAVGLVISHVLEVDWDDCGAHMHQTVMFTVIVAVLEESDDPVNDPN